MRSGTRGVVAHSSEPLERIGGFDVRPTNRNFKGRMGNPNCGSSREQACCSCLTGYELTIVARGFARIIDAGGLIAYTRRRVMKAAGKA